MDGIGRRRVMLCYSIFAGTVAIIIISAAAQDYPNCSRQFECGDIRIGYPFSGSKRAANCGLPKLRLICGAIATPMIGILGIPHKILRIDEPSRTLTLLRDGDGDILCYPPRNTTLDPGFFDFAPDTQFAMLYYYCPPPDASVRLPPSIGQFNCSSGSGGYFLPSEYLLGGFEDSVRTWLRSCRIMVRMPTNRTELWMPANQTELGIRRRTAASADWLATVMYRGFGLRWTGDYEGACRNCKGSGGKCGFNETATRPFVCYCSDQAYAFNCLSLTNVSPPEKALDKAEGKNRVLLKIVLPIAAFVTLSVAAITFFYCIRTRASQNQNGKASSPLPKPLEFIKMQRAKSGPFGGQGNVESPPSLQAFTFSEIKTATNDFSDDNLLGAGGFGPVYKCVFPGDEEMAVKRLSKSSTQGLLEFTNEVSLTARLQHVNLVRVVGFCTEKDEKMLVYEFMPNRSLDIHLFDPVKRLSLDLSTRIRIIEGVTQGLLYLQEYSNFTIIHRDIKASNVLLDDGMNPKISDFGMAKLFMKDLYEANTNKIVGTYGYVPPEYVKNGIYSIKYDVYSFGVLLLQIISSKRTQDYYGPNEDMHLLDHAYESWRRGECMEFCDPSLDDSSSECKLMTCLQVALLCVQEDPNDRPTMLEVAFALRTGALKMASPKKPAFSVRLEPVSPTTPKFRQEIWSYNVADISQVEPR